MKLYKLTDQNMQTHNSFKYELGVSRTATEEGTTLCTPQVLHAYRDPILGLILNPVHANFKKPRLFEAEGDSIAGDYGKVGVKTLTLTRELAVPDVTSDMRTEFAIRCALQCYNTSTFVAWAEGWLSGEDRTAAAAYAAACAAYAYADAAYAAARAADAAYAAARAAYAYADARAAYAYADAAACAAYAAACAAYAFDPIKVLEECSFYKQALAQIVEKQV